MSKSVIETPGNSNFNASLPLYTGITDRTISPRARILAERKGVDITGVIPTGAERRITEKDVADYAAGFTGSGNDGNATGTGIGGRISAGDKSIADYDEEPVTNIRKIIAHSMQQSLANMAQLTFNSSFDASNILVYRANVKAQATQGTPNVTLNDIVLYCTARILTRHKYVNAHFLDDKYRLFKHAHIGMAVDTERGLLVPTLFNADTLSLEQISDAAARVASKAKNALLLPDELSGGTFTVTNLGSLGVESFTPIINPPQTCILGVCGLTEKVRKVNGMLVAYQSMGLSLTFDHRALDGAPAARFLKDLCAKLESFGKE